MSTKHICQFPENSDVVLLKCLTSQVGNASFYNPVTHVNTMYLF